MVKESSSYKWVVLAIATIAQASACFFVQGFGSIAINVKQALSLSDWQIGLLVSAAQLVPLLGLLIAGELLDRYSERYVVGLGTMLVGISLCGAGMVNSYNVVLTMLLVLGLGYSTAQPGGSKSVSGWFKNSQLGFAMGLRQAGLPFGGAVATLLLPYVALKYSYKEAFLFSGIVACLGALLFMAFYRTPAPTVAREKKVSSFKTAAMARLSMAAEPSMINIMLTGASLTAAQYGISIFLVLYLHSTVGLPVEVATKMFFVVLGFGVMGRILLAIWSDKCNLGRIFPVLACLLGTAIALIILPFISAGNEFVLIVFMAFTGFFSYGWYGPWVAYIADTAPADRKGFALGMAMTANQVGVILVPPTIGFMKDYFGTYTYGWSGLAAVCMLVLFNVSRRGALRAPIMP